MDLIYMNQEKEDVGVLLDYEIDLAFGADENNFECTITSGSHCCQPGYYLYFDGTEYGGIIDAIESDTAKDDVIYSGRTWHGIIASKIIMPLQAGETSTSTVTLKTADSKGNTLVNRYLIVSGDANACIAYMLSRLGLGDLFHVSGASAGVNINNYQFNRFANGYAGITAMLSSAGLKLKTLYKNGMIHVSAEAKTDHSNDGEFDNDLIALQVKRQYKKINHLICLGSGELEKRMVVHLYADAAGSISRTQTISGLDEYASVYDYPSVESEEELIESGVEELQKLQGADDIAVDLDESIDNYDVGDVVSGVDNVTGISAKTTVTKKIVTIKNGKISISIGTGKASSGGSGATGDGAATRYATAEELTAHIDDASNPHSVTAAQVGAATTAELTAHTSSKNNPHSVTAAQVGAATTADLTAHTSSKNNPHSVTAAQVGAATTADLTAHTSSKNNPHSVTAAQVGAANRNLLDNWDFRNPVNQRGKTTYSGSGYTIDRWRIPANCTLSVTDNGVTFGNNTTGNGFVQYIEKSERLAGKELTLTFEAVNSDISFKVYAKGTNLSTKYGNESNAKSTLTFLMPVNASDVYCGIVICTAQSSVTITRAKLELGSTSTLSNDAPADYSQELRKCQRYFYRIANSQSYGVLPFLCMTDGTPTLIASIPTPVPMRISPTIAQSGLRVNGIWQPVTSMTICDYSSTHINVAISVPAGLTANTAYVISGNPVGYITLSADL